MSFEVGLHQGRPAEFEVTQRQKISDDHTTLYYTIYEQLEFDQWELSTAQVVDQLSMNQDILLPFQQSPIKEIQRQFKDLSENLELEEKKLKKLIKITQQLYQYALINSSISQILPVRNTEIESLLKLTDRKEVQLKRKAIEREARVPLRKLRYSDIRNLKLPEVKEHLSTLHQLSDKCSSIINLKKYTDEEENTRMYDLATVYQKQKAPQQFPRILDNYPRIVKQVEKLSPEINSVSKTLEQIRTYSLKLFQRQEALITPQTLSQIEEQVLKPFGQVVYPAAAECFWQSLRNSVSQNNDPKLNSLIESGTLNSPIPENLDYIYLNNLWPCYFSEPQLKDFGFEEWMSLVLKEIEADKLSLLCNHLQNLTKSVNEICENANISKPQKEQLTTPYRAEMMEKTVAQLQEILSKNQKTLAEIHAFLTAKSLK